MIRYSPSGVIPQITAIFGTCGGGAALIPNLTDVTFMTKEGAKLFVNSPNALDENRAEKLDTAAADYVAENTANVDAVYDTEAELLGAVRTMVGLLPSNNEDDGDCAVCEDDVNRIIPDLATKAGDVKAVIADITDDEFVFELKIQGVGVWRAGDGRVLKYPATAQVLHRVSPIHLEKRLQTTANNR